jgi:hypothetical protein
MKSESDKNNTINLCFLVGLPDSKEIKISGYNKDGQIKYDWPGNSDFHNYINIPDSARNYMTIIWHAEPKRSIKIPDVIINCISDADICNQSLKRAIAICEGVQKHSPKTKIFNDPKNISKTTRDSIYQNYKNTPELLIPKVIRIRPDSATEVLDLAKSNNIEYPFLVRPCGSHQSEELQKIDNKKDIEKLHRLAFDGREFYITQFIDNKHKDGFYRKARFVIIDGKLHVRHYITYPEWLVEGAAHFNYMPDNDDSKRVEEHFLNNYQKIISAKALDSLHQIYNDIGLNYLGFDVDVMPDGSLLIFEINVAQNAFLKIDMKNFAYMKQTGDAIISALNDSIKAKISYNN